MHRCYSERCDYTLDELGDDAWQTGCPLCGGVCWDLDEKLKKEIDAELDSKGSKLHTLNEVHMNEFEEEDQIIADKIEIEKCIGEEVLAINKKKVKKMSQNMFDKLVDKICIGNKVDINNPLNEFVEDKLVEALEKIKVKLEKFL